MKELKLTVSIDRPMHEVWDFVLNPENTPKWIDGIVAEETNESPTKLGTIYKNRNREGNWTEYEITELNLGSVFVMSQKGGSYHVRYTLKPLDDDRCELEYHEWVDVGELEEPFTQDILNKLKTVMETPRRYVITLKSGRELITGKFDNDEAVLRWVATGAAGIVYQNEHVRIIPDEVEKIQRIENGNE